MKYRCNPVECISWPFLYIIVGCGQETLEDRVLHPSVLHPRVSLWRFYFSLRETVGLYSQRYTVGCTRRCRVLFFLVLSDILYPGYVFVNIGVNANIPSHEASNLYPLELFIADDSSNSHLLSKIREKERRSELTELALISNLGEPYQENWYHKFWVHFLVLL